MRQNENEEDESRAFSFIHLHERSRRKSEIVDKTGKEVKEAGHSYKKERT